jgi:hypothetical protein
MTEELFYYEVKSLKRILSCYISETINFPEIVFLQKSVTLNTISPSFKFSENFEIETKSEKLICREAKKAKKTKILNVKLSKVRYFFLRLLKKNPKRKKDIKKRALKKNSTNCANCKKNSTKVNSSKLISRGCKWEDKGNLPNKESCPEFSKCCTKVNKVTSSFSSIYLEHSDLPYYKLPLSSSVISLIDESKLKKAINSILELLNTYSEN